MLIINQIKKSLPVFIGLLILWAGLFFYASILNKSNEDLKHYIPEDANFVMNFEVKNFIKSATYSLIFNSKDQDLLNTFDLFLSKQRKGKGKTKEIGIDFTQDIVLFGKKHKKGQVYVVLFNILSKKRFDRNIRYYLSDKQQTLRKGNIGFIATYHGKNKINKQELIALLEGIEYNENTVKPTKVKEFFKMDFNNYAVNENFNINRGQISTLIKDHHLQMKGDFSMNNSEYQVSKWTLIPAGLHLENSLLTKNMQDSLRSYFTKMGIDYHEIDRFSMNYYGVEIQETDKGVIFTPLFDLLLTFKEKYVFSNMFKDLSYLKEFGFEKEKNVLHAGQIHYFIDSIDQQTFFIGNHENQVVARKSKTIFNINGDLTNLTNIKGGGFIMNSVIGMFPPFKASKNIFEKVKTIDIQASAEDRHVKLKGNIEMKDNQYLYNEFLRFYLTLKGEL